MKRSVRKPAKPSSSQSAPTEYYIVNTSANFTYVSSITYELAGIDELPSFGSSALVYMPNHCLARAYASLILVPII
jgi:hypothetical protein